MSEENVDTVRGAIEALNRREMRLDYLDPEVEWVEDPRYPDAQTYRGHDGVQHSIEKWWDTWASLTLRVEELVDAGNQVVFWGVTEAPGKGARRDGERPLWRSLGIPRWIGCPRAGPRQSGRRPQGRRAVGIAALDEKQQCRRFDRPPWTGIGSMTNRPR
jgi:SnoaL-like domain